MRPESLDMPVDPEQRFEARFVKLQSGFVCRASHARRLWYALRATVLCDSIGALFAPQWVACPHSARCPDRVFCLSGSEARVRMDLVLPRGPTRALAMSCPSQVAGNSPRCEAFVPAASRSRPLVVGPLARRPLADGHRRRHCRRIDYRVPPLVESPACRCRGPLWGSMRERVQ